MVKFLLGRVSDASTQRDAPISRKGNSTMVVDVYRLRTGRLPRMVA